MQPVALGQDVSPTWRPRIEPWHEFGAGPPDLPGQAYTGELAHAQYASARRLAAELPDETRVFPTHGFGSFCSGDPGRGRHLHDRPGEAGQSR